MQALQILIGGVLATALPPLLLALVVLPFVAVWRWRGAWRLLALLPMAVLAWMGTRFSIDIARDPTAHNLWPLTLMLWGAGSCAFLFLLWLMQRWRA
jgi:hypothetical protein